MIGILGRGRFTPLDRLEARPDEVVLDDEGGLTYSPLAIRLLTALAGELHRCSRQLGLVESRFLSTSDLPHEQVALAQAWRIGEGGGGFLGSYQIAEKHRTEPEHRPPFRLPVFLMWEAFTHHRDADGWLPVADAARTILSELLGAPVHPTRSLNTLDGQRDAQEYTLVHPDGDQQLRSVPTGGFVNVELAGSAEEGDDALARGFELGNSYSLHDPGHGPGGAHSIGLDRLLGALLLCRPTHLLDWRGRPFAVDRAIADHAIDAEVLQRLGGDPELTLVGTGEHAELVSTAAAARGSMIAPGHLVPMP